MQKSSLIVTIQTALLATSLLTAPCFGAEPKVVLKDIRFTGDLGLPLRELQEYTEFLNGQRMEQAKMLKDGSSAVAMGLRHRGYLKAQVTPRLHSLKRSTGSNNAGVALELTIKAGKQYRVEDITFTGLSSELTQTELRQAFNIQRGDVADAEEIGQGIGRLIALFQRRGKDISVIPNMSFNDVASTVSLQFDIRK